MEKVCKKCGKSFPIEWFFRNKNSKDGYMPNCKGCHGDYIEARRKANPIVDEKAKEYRKKYYQANRERLIKQNYENELKRKKEELLWI